MKKQMKGFTLVELIVVIAIIGVLAAILVPSMMGWIAKANMRTANSGAKQVYNNAQSIAAELEGTADFIPATASSTIGDGSNRFYSTFSGAGNDLTSIGSTYSSEMIKKFADAKNALWAIQYFDTGSVTHGAPDNIEPGTVVAAAFCKKPDSGNCSNYVGTFPELADNKKGKYSGVDILSGPLADATDEYYAAAAAV